MESNEKAIFTKKNYKKFLNGKDVSFEAVGKLKEDTFYTILNEEVRAVELFSQETNLYYKLKPTRDWPTIMISSVPMHRFKTVTPKQSAELMVSSLGKLTAGAKVLDTCCGLGYTAILAAKQKEVKEVHTFEVDENVLSLAEYNPFSRELFTNKKVFLHKESVFERIKRFSNGYFDAILHDPPTVSLARQLYELDFYKELFRVLEGGGKLYHYCPSPGKTKGKTLFPSLIKKLGQAGFVGADYNEKSSGIVARKK